MPRRPSPPIIQVRGNRPTSGTPQGDGPARRSLASIADDATAVHTRSRKIRSTTARQPVCKKTVTIDTAPVMMIDAPCVAAPRSTKYRASNARTTTVPNAHTWPNTREQSSAHSMRRRCFSSCSTSLIRRAKVPGPSSSHCLACAGVGSLTPAGAFLSAVAGSFPVICRPFRHLSYRATGPLVNCL